jgi:hypothetical protein
MLPVKVNIGAAAVAAPGQWQAGNDVKFFPSTIFFRDMIPEKSTENETRND